MRRFIIFGFMLCLTTCVWGQAPKFARLGALTHAEDSPESIANNEIFYNSPRPPEPEILAPAGKVSVEQLQHPLSRKGEKLLRQAHNFEDMGNHDKAIAELRLALKEPSALPYAYSLLGSEYLRLGKIAAAIEALEQAIKLLPRSAVNHANLGYALFLRGDLERAEGEVRRALSLDRDNEKTLRVLSLIAHSSGGSGQ
jgi:tetratricopeptide (TPR) repeat protein